MIQKLKRESWRRAEMIFPSISQEYDWMEQWVERNALDMSGYNIVDSPSVMEERVETMGKDGI